ncbi:hypothetical protein ACIBSW_18045 [Actinoplanes sp. NPDC049668]|uniref:hypothetical protein n=1 Tax=unclassified Actinoplanes TaxID=2626549 RepID=UPI0033B486B5
MTAWQQNNPVPPPQRRPIESRRVAIGFAIAMGVQLLTLVPILLGLTTPDGLIFGGLGYLALQALLVPALLVTGIVLTVRQDGGRGVGLMIGWAIGGLVSFGGCLALLNAGGGQ